ncbi:hypothetical protein KFY57_26560, partial [Salmonella enterica subsp. enterica serovar Typhimurium]|nr:hypothetical protein [Salmonella enterica subsp. enterica serovar Typhimurium]
HVTFDEIERSDGHVSETTAEETTKGTGSIELRGVHLDLSRFVRCWNEEALIGRGQNIGGFGSGSRNGFAISEKRRSRWGVEKAWKKRLTGGVLHD